MGDTARLQILSSPFSKLFPLIEMWPPLPSIPSAGSHQGLSPSKDLGHCRIISLVPPLWGFFFKRYRHCESAASVPQGFTPHLFEGKAASRPFDMRQQEKHRCQSAAETMARINSVQEVQFRVLMAHMLAHWGGSQGS